LRLVQAAETIVLIILLLIIWVLYFREKIKRGALAPLALK
jgi:hypothetical protein